MPADGQLRYLNLNDFTPGIMQKSMRATTSAGSYPLGSAQSTNTHRCIALPGGGLGPLPKRNTAYTLTAPEGASATDDAKYHIVGFYSFGPVSSGTPPAGPDELHIGVEYIIGAVRKFRWYRMRIFDGSNTLDTLKSINSAEASPPAIFWGMSFATQRMNPGALTSPGFPVVVTSWEAGAGGVNEKFITVYPDPTTVVTAATNAIKDLSTTRYGAVITHQNRVVLLEGLVYPHGTPGAMFTNEQISFTDANGFTLGTQAQVFMPEFPNGYGAYGSMSAGELFLVKQQGGGVIVQGDIANPSIIRLPGVPSVGNLSARAVSTPVGLLYPVNEGGIWSWRGGDSSTKMSDALEDDFFVAPGTVSHNNERVFLAEWHDWVLVSNNWLLDTRTGSWWRIEDPSVFTFLHWSRGFNATWMYGAAGNVASGANNIFAYEFKRTLPASSYSWQSHPMFVEDGDRKVDVRELVITGQGAGTIAVSFIKEDGSTISTHTATFTSTTQAKRFKFNVHAEMENVQVKIVSTATSTGPAPVCYGVRVGWQPATRLVVAA